MSYGDFHSQRFIQATKKTHYCDQCGKAISVGSATQYKAGKYDGDFYSDWTHIECHNAAQEYASMNGLWGEEYPWFQHMDNVEDDHHAWLLENHPIVAERLNIDRQEPSPSSGS